MYRIKEINVSDIVGLGISPRDAALNPGRFFKTRHPGILQSVVLYAQATQIRTQES